MSSTSPAPGGFSLFPSPSSSTPPRPIGTPSRPRRSESRERRAQTPQSTRTRTPQPGELSLATSPPRTNGRKTPQLQAQSPSSPQQQQQSPPRQRQRQASVSREQQQQQQQLQSPARERQQQQSPPPREQTPVAVPVPAPVVAEEPQPQQHPLQAHPSRLVRNPDRSSISKPPLEDETGTIGQVRSIFPTYNPNVPLNQQNYAPTQLGPAGIPKAVISRQSFFPNDDAEGLNQEPPAPVTTRSPLRGGTEADDPRWGHVVPMPRDPPVEPQTCTTSQLKSFWRVANGWKATPLEGRVYCMKLDQEKDAPVYTLSSSTQPFYNIRIDPTSASAYVTVKRHDPNKPYKDPTAESPTSGNSLLSAVSGATNSSPRASKITDGKHWTEALTTTLEEDSRRHQPNDGLVALLMPRAAAKMAVERANDPQAVYTAERECARLVWDDDSAMHFLVHPALATPFCVTIDRSPAWSRVEYTLEHHESPQHLAKLTRDGTGAGWLEFDTGLASKIESCYIADVAITALILVASADEKNRPVAETFEPPPVLPPPQTLFLKSNSSREKVFGKAFGKKNKGPVEVFELDLESQSSSMGKNKKKKDTKVKEGLDKLPFVLRIPAKLARLAFKALIWIFTQLFGCFKAMFCCCYSVVGSKY